MRARAEPNSRATTVEAYPGLVGRSQSGYPSVDTDTLNAAIDYLDQKIAQARENHDPVPFSRYRTRIILKKTLGIRSRQF